MIRTAEGALSEVHTSAPHDAQPGLCANTANDETSIAADQAQIESSLAALNRIASNTQFGTKNHWTLSNSLIFQVGANANQTTSVDISGVSASDLSIAGINVTSDTNAITALDTAISNISTLRACATQRDLESNISSLGIAKENIAASESSIEMQIWQERW